MDAAAELRISPREAWARVERDEAILLDVVGDESWERLNAVPARSLRIPPGEVESRVDTLPRDRAIIAFCT